MSFSGKQSEDADKQRTCNHREQPVRAMAPQELSIGVMGHGVFGLEKAPRAESFIVSLHSFPGGSAFGSAFVAAKAPIE